jgi:peptidoglycan/xylan/chitin deacetylase (PgdA/CDA1 family)
LRNWLPILCYHRVCREEDEQDRLGLCATTARLERVLRYLSARGYRFATLDTAVQVVRSGRPAGGRYVCLTFDDGYQDFYDTAFPLLKKYGARATVFLVTGCIDGTNRWDEAEGATPIPMLSRRQILELDRQGIEFGSHSVSHLRLTSLTSDEREKEISGSKEELEQLLGHEVRFFCYPHGDCNAEVREGAKRAGYVGACGIEQATNEPFLLHRIDATKNGWLTTLLRLWGWRHSLQRNRVLRALRQKAVRSHPASVEVVETRK